MLIPTVHEVVTARTRACHSVLTKGKNGTELKNELTIHYMIYYLNIHLRIKRSTFISNVGQQELTKIVQGKLHI